MSEADQYRMSVGVYLSMSVGVYLSNSRPVVSWLSRFYANSDVVHVVLELHAKSYVIEVRRTA